MKHNTGEIINNQNRYLYPGKHTHILCMEIVFIVLFGGRISENKPAYQEIKEIEIKGKTFLLFRVFSGLA